MRGKVLSILALALVGCGNQSATLPSGTSEGVVNGKNVTEPNVYSKHTVFIQMQMGKGGGVCTGSILDSQTILTAAHCVYGVTNAVVIFALNAQDPKTITADQVRRVDIAAIYPKYQPQPEHEDNGSPSLVAPVIPPPVPTVDQIAHMLDASDDVDYDVALLHFNGGLPAGYSAVTLGSAENLLKPGVSLHMIGYGLAKVGSRMAVVNGQPVFIPVPDQSTVGQLRETDLPIAVYNSRARMILTDSGETGVCSGDSGGPAFVQDPNSGQVVQVGIAEAVANRYCNSVSMHTSIFPYLDWIGETSAKMAKKAKNPPGVIEASL